MNLTINELPAETFHSLANLARNNGQSVEEYVREMIEVKVSAARKFDEILAPMREDFEKGGMTEDELDALVEEARETIYQEKLKVKATKV